MAVAFLEFTATSIADSSSRNAVSFSSARTTNRFPSPRCASTIQIVRPLESRAETQPQLPTGFADLQLQRDTFCPARQFPRNLATCWRVYVCEGICCMGTVRELRNSVYVILLDEYVGTLPQMRLRNPRRNPSKPCVYIGLTPLGVGRRFDFRGATPKTEWRVHRY